MLGQRDTLQVDGRFDILDALLVVNFLRDAEVYLDQTLHGDERPIAQLLTPLDRVQNMVRTGL